MVLKWLAGAVGLASIMATLTSDKAAQLIREATGRPCSRQNLEQHCHNGRLPRSTVSLAPIRLSSQAGVFRSGRLADLSLPILLEDIELTICKVLTS
jgi:hypothetical protein